MQAAMCWIAARAPASSRAAAPNVLRVNGAGNVVAVISWRRARLDIALVAADSKVLLRSQVPLEEQDDGVEKINPGLFRDAAARRGQCPPDGVSIIIPGIVDSERGRILSTVIGVGFEDPVIERLSRALAGYSLCFLNDTACFAYAESVFTRIEEPYFAYINVSKGVGACLFADGKMLRGAGAMATQFGHYSIDRNGRSARAATAAAWSALWAKTPWASARRHAGWT